MNSWNWWITMWETHCDTIGDYFKNPYILRVLRQWYRLKNIDVLAKWEKLAIWLEKKDKDKGFTQEFYSFIQDIFKDEWDIEEFLSFLKAQYIDKPKVKDDILYEYQNEDIVRLLLCFDEVREQLWFDGMWQSYTQTISSIFSTRIVDILREAYAKFPLEESEMNIHESMIQMLTRWHSPISEDWEILCHIAEWEDWAVQVVALKDQSEEVFPVTTEGMRFHDYEITDIDEEGGILYNREDVLVRIREVKEILSYHLEEIDDEELTDKQQRLKKSLLDVHAQQKWLILKDFSEIVWNFIEELYVSLKKLPVKDDSHSLPLWESGKLTHNWVAKLRVEESEGDIHWSSKEITWKPPLKRAGLMVYSS